jgi:hypothetical protein
MTVALSLRSKFANKIGLLQTFSLFISRLFLRKMLPILKDYNLGPFFALFLRPLPRLRSPVHQWAGEELGAASGLGVDRSHHIRIHSRPHQSLEFTEKRGCFLII